MTDTPDGDIEQCPECGGDVSKGRKTEAYAYFSCVRCDWIDEVKDGEYR